MAISLYAGVVILRDWCSEQQRVRFSYIARSISVTYSLGMILEVSENKFTFGSERVTATVNIEFLSNADFVLPDDFASVLPPEIMQRLHGNEKCALTFKGAAGELAVILM